MLAFWRITSVSFLDYKEISVRAREVALMRCYDILGKNIHCLKKWPELWMVENQKKIKDLAVQHTCAAMFSPLLVRALADFYQVNAVIVCLSLALTSDADRGIWVDLAKDVEMYTEFGFPRDSIVRDLERVLIIPDSACVQDALRTFGLKQNVVWLLDSDSETYEPPDLRLDSNWILAETQGNETTLQEKYRIKRSEHKTNLLGTWSPQSGLHLSIPQRWIRRGDFGGIRLDSTILPWPFLGVLTEDKKNATGFVPDAFAVLQVDLNFTSRLVLPEDGEWGVRRCPEEGNGTSGGCFWSGMVGQLEKKEVDVCIAGLSMTLERNEAIDYTIGMAPDPITLVVGTATAQSSSINWTAYLEVLKEDTWVATVIAALALAVAYAVITNGLASRGSSPSALFSESFSGFAYFGLCFLQLSADGRRFASVSSKILFLSCSCVCYMTYQVNTFAYKIPSPFLGL